MKKQIPPQHDDEFAEPHARLASIPIGSADAFWLPVYALRSMWSASVLKATLSMFLTTLIAGVLCVLVAMVSRGILAQLVQATLLTTGAWIGLVPLLRSTARDEDCGWHLDEAEQSPAASAVKRIALTAGLWQIVTVLIMYGAVFATAVFAAMTRPWMLVLIALPLLLIAPILMLMSAAALTRNAIEERPVLSSLRESFTRVQFMNAFKTASLASVIPTVLIVVIAAIVVISMGKALVATATSPLLIMMAPLMIVGVLAKHPVAASLILITCGVASYMYTIACLLEYLDRIHERDADDLDSVDAGVHPDAGQPAPAAQESAAPASSSAPPSPFRTLVLAAGTAPAAAAAAAWKAHRDLRKTDEDAAREVMLENARAHIGSIVTHRTADEALLMFEDCSKADDGFEPGADARIGLARYAIGSARPELALKLISGFDKRFVDHPQIPVAYAIAHEALTATGKADVANRVLAAMRHRYPEHPMTKRLAERPTALG